MKWMRIQFLEELEQTLCRDKPGVPSIILLEGEDGMGKANTVNYLLENLSENCCNIVRHDFLSSGDSIGTISVWYIKKLAERKHPLFHEFLGEFSELSNDYIVQAIRGARELPDETELWFDDLFLHYLSWLADRKRIIFVFENVHAAGSTEIDHLISFQSKLEHLPAAFLFTSLPDMPRKADFNPAREFQLTRLSVQEVEKNIQDYLQTTSLNARIITNQCYLKTNGNPLHIRLLVEGNYRPLIGESRQDPIDIKKFQKIRVSPDWQDAFGSAFEAQNEQGKQFLTYLAYLGEAVRDVDLAKLLEALEISNEWIQNQLEAGLIQYRFFDGNRYYTVAFDNWENWLRQNTPVESLKPLLIKMYSILKSDPVFSHYRYSSLYFDCGETEKAVSLSLPEINTLLRKGCDQEAAGRLFFLVRLYLLNPEEIPGIKEILERLGNLYVRLGAYENAFEMFRNLRELFRPDSKAYPADIIRGWLWANVSMAKALLMMDAYQEARYLIREIRAKDYPDDSIAGICSEMQGDIEINLGHESYAFTSFQEALESFAKAKSERDIYRVYQKIKKNFARAAGTPDNMLPDILEKLRICQGDPAFLAGVMRDQIQQAINQQQFEEALVQGRDLKRLLRKVYYPRLEVQLSFYFAEIFAWFGKWRIAVAHIQEVLVHPFVLSHAYLRVQSMLQLGLLYKEQMQYGRARQALEEGLEVCFSNHYLTEQNEIKLHLGHLYLSVHGFLRAWEYLKECHEWAEKNQQPEILLMSSLYLSNYELQRGMADRARVWLREAKKLLNLSRNPVDHLNYLFYLGLWLLETGRGRDAGTVGNLIIARSAGHSRYQAIGYYLLTRSYLLQEDFEKANSALERGIDIAVGSRLAQLHYMLRSVGVRLARAGGHESLFLSRLEEACNTLREISSRIYDPILQTQFLEASDHEDILKWCRLHIPGFKLK